jgi:hypothetical protein
MASASFEPVERTKTPAADAGASPSILCLTGKMGVQIRNIPIVTAAYLSFAFFGAFVWALVSLSWFMLIPVVGGLVLSLVSIYFLRQQTERKRKFEEQVPLQPLPQVNAVRAILIEDVSDLKSQAAKKGQ